jgi:hypothetical protein
MVLRCGQPGKQGAIIGESALEITAIGLCLPAVEFAFLVEPFASDAHNLYIGANLKRESCSVWNSVINHESEKTIHPIHREKKSSEFSINSYENRPMSFDR